MENIIEQKFDKDKRLIYESYINNITRSKEESFYIYLKNGEILMKHIGLNGIVTFHYLITKEGEQCFITKEEYDRFEYNNRNKVSRFKIMEIE